MSNRQISSRFLLAGITLVIISAFAFANVWSGSSFGKVSAETAASPKSEAPAPLAPNTCDGGSNVDVESTGGTALAGYTTVKGAFDAINAGTHTGTIIIEICTSTTEGTTPATLNGTGQGSASYTSINMYPIADGLTVTGNPATGFGVIQLKGADSVTIDGDNPNSGGTNRNLTISNTNTNTAIAGSVIRVATVAAVAASADSITLRNMILSGNVTSGNTAAITSTTGSSNSSFGIYVGGNGGTTATDAPTAITSVTAQIIPAATTVNSFVVNNNAINQTARGVVFNGAATNNSNGVTVSNNTIGSATPGDVNGVYSMGMTIQGSTLVNVSGNTIYVESYLSTSIRAIDIGSISTAVSGVTIEKNRIARVWGNSISGFGAYGINLAGGSSHIVQNNFIYNINAFLNNSAISSTFGPHGIRAASGTGHTVYHNSVNIFGAAIGASSTSLASAMTIVATTQTGMNVRNNIFANTLTGAFSSSTPVVSIFLPSGGTSAMNLTLNNNLYAQGSGSGAAIGQAGTTSGTGVYLAANFVASSTSPASNMRSYTSTLSAAGTNDNASIASGNPTPFTSNTDLHIPAATATLLESGGAAVGVATDIDGDARPNGTAPDIGADEFVGVAPPANDIAASSFITPTNGGVVLNGATISPQASFSNVGTATQTNINVQYTITGPGGYNYSNSQVIASLANGASTTVTFAAAPVFTMAGSYVTSAAVTTADANAANDTINGGFTVADPISGAYTVGGGGNFNSLTNPGGVFDSINSLGMTGNTVVTIQGDLTSETGTVALNQFATPFTLTIQSSGARTVSGANTTALINLNGADNVTINGLNTGGNSLLIRNTSATTGAVVLMTNDASTNTLQNCTIEGGNTNASSGLVFIGAGTTTGNDNNTITNNVVRDRTDAVGVPTNSVVSLNASITATNSNNVVSNNSIMNFVNNGFATSAAASSNNWTVNNNDISQNAARAGNTFAINTGGMIGTNTISGNSIHGLTTTGTNAALGFLVGNSLGLTISNNRVYDFQTTAGATGVIEGLEYDGASGGAANLTFRNNMISLAPTLTTAQSIIGIQDFAFGGNTFTGDHNTVYIGGAASGAAPSWAMKRGNLAPTTYTARNNLLINNRTGGTSSHFAGGDDSANTGTFVSDHNYFAGTGSTPANFMDYGTSASGTPVSPAAWQTGPPARDANSFFTLASGIVVTDILVNTATGDLHLKSTAGVSILGVATPVAGVTTDFDGDPRPAAGVDRGADELVQSEGGVYPAGTFYNGLFTNGHTFAGNVNFTGTLWIIGGANVNLGAGVTVGIGCNATVSPQVPSVNYIVGDVRKDFCGTGVFTFPVGTVGNGSARTAGDEDPEGFLGEYSPMTATVTAGTFPSSLTVNVVDTWLPNLGTTSSISRYWNVTETGDLTTNMLFQYLNEDPYGDETMYAVFKWDGATTAAQPGTVNGALNQFTATNVTSYSGWAAGINVINAANASISGRVTTANGNGIRNAMVRLTGGDLTQPLIVQTGSLGYYYFPELQVGQTYVLEVGAKRFRFANPSRIITLQDNLEGLDFVANPQD